MLNQKITSDKIFQFVLFSPLKRLLNHAIFPRKQNDKKFDIGKNESNRKTIKKELGFKKLFFLGQIHSKKVLVIKNDKMKDAEEIKGYDALITDQPGIGLLIKTADCQPILMFDPKQKVAAAIHNGWRGAMRNIIQETVFRMEKEFKVNPKNILAVIGPSLGPCCAAFSKPYEEILPEYHAFITGNRVDLWKISLKQLREAGVTQIELAGICTKCHNNIWFSYRGDTKNKGRFGSVIGIKGLKPQE